jgi:RNA polymerase sigma-70 factor (ECF subfamily)
LFDTYADRIYGVAHAYTRSPQLSEEIVQDVFMKIWMKKDALPHIKNIADYIFIISRNQIINQIRRQRLEKNYLSQLLSADEGNFISPESEYVIKESRNLIFHAIGQLPPQQRTIYQLNQLQGMRLGEIASVLGLSRNTVRNHLSRAMHFIREYLRSHADEQTILFLIIFIALH